MEEFFSFLLLIFTIFCLIDGFLMFVLSAEVFVSLRGKFGLEEGKICGFGDTDLCGQLSGWCIRKCWGDNCSGKMLYWSTFDTIVDKTFILLCRMSLVVMQNSIIEYICSILLIDEFRNKRI